MQIYRALPATDCSWASTSVETLKHLHGSRRITEVGRLALYTAIELNLHLAATTAKFTAALIQVFLSPIAGGVSPRTALIDACSHLARSAKLIPALLSTPVGIFRPDLVVDLYQRLSLVKKPWGNTSTIYGVAAALITGSVLATIAFAMKNQFSIKPQLAQRFTWPSTPQIAMAAMASLAIELVGHHCFHRYFSPVSWTGLNDQYDRWAEMPGFGTLTTCNRFVARSLGVIGCLVKWSIAKNHCDRDCAKSHIKGALKGFLPAAAKAIPGVSWWIHQTGRYLSKVSTERLLADAKGFHQAGQLLQQNKPKTREQRQLLYWYTAVMKEVDSRSRNVSDLILSLTPSKADGQSLGVIYFTDREGITWELFDNHEWEPYPYLLGPVRANDGQTKKKAATKVEEYLIYRDGEYVSERHMDAVKLTVANSRQLLQHLKDNHKSGPHLRRSLEQIPEGIKRAELNDQERPNKRLCLWPKTFLVT